MGIHKTRGDKVARQAQFSLGDIAAGWCSVQPCDDALMDAQAPGAAERLLRIGCQEDGIAQQHVKDNRSRRLHVWGGICHDEGLKVLVNWLLKIFKMVNQK